MTDYKSREEHLEEALEFFLEEFIRSASSGDWGDIDIEDLPEIIKAREALKNKNPSKSRMALGIVNNMYESAVAQGVNPDHRKIREVVLLGLL